MAEVIIVGYQDYDFAKSLVVGEIVYEDFFLDLSSYNGLIFTSKNAILSLQANSEKYPSMQIYKQIPSYLIGTSSAKTLQTMGGRVAFVSKYAHGKEFAKELEDILVREKRYAYFRAKEIVSNLDFKLCESGFDVESFCAYRSCARSLDEKLKPSKGSVLLFTSPSAYRFFLQNFTWDESYVAYALGKTTFESFQQGINAKISDSQQIKEAYLFLKESFLDNKN